MGDYMAGGYFKACYGKDPAELATVAAIDKEVEKKLGHEMDVKLVHPDISSLRGSIFPIKVLNADKIFDKALKK